MHSDIAGLRLCICTPDYLHIVKNGGIGTSFAHSARILSRLGAQVTILYTNTVSEFPAAALDLSIENIERDGVHFELLFDDVNAGLLDQILPNDVFTVSSYCVFQWLKSRDFQVVIFPDWRGIGFFSLTAKQQGLAFQRTRFWVQAHSTALWHELNNNVDRFTELNVRCFLYERRQIELCDRLICPSHYLLGWKEQHGFRLPAQTHLVPYLFDSDLVQQAHSTRSHLPLGTKTAIEEIVFFGRLERRKGLIAFLRALLLLVKTRPDRA